MSASQPSTQPAILGGCPVRPKGSPDWPLENLAVSEALQRCLADRSWGKYHGPNCKQFAERLAEYHDCEHIVLCSSGTAAIELALRGLKVGEGDEVILAAYDFKGNFQNVLTVGATPVLIDVDPDNWNMDANQLSDAITDRTKAIVVSHLHGGVVPMAEVIEVAQLHGLSVIEDACQIPGATVDGQKAGTWGDVGILSFGGSKLLTAGRGGTLFTNNAEIVQRARLFSHRGNESYPLSELQAAVLIPQLEQLDDANRHRSDNATRLCELLEVSNGVVPFRNPQTKRITKPGYFKFGCQYDARAFHGLSRVSFSEAMRAEGIALAPGFRSLHVIHSRQRFHKTGDLSNATDADQRVLTLHHPILLGDESDMHQFVEALDKIRRHATMIRRLTGIRSRRRSET